MKIACVAAACLLAPLASCVGEIDVFDEETASEVEPAYGLWDPPVGGRTMNGLAFSAIITDPATVEELLSRPLSSSTYLASAAPGSALWELQLRTSDPETTVFFDYLVACALSAGQAPVKRMNPVDSSDITVHHGAIGFCPAWADGPVLGDSTCTEKVSACLLSLVNELESHVAVSLRSQDGVGNPIPLASEVTPHTEDISAFDYCYSPSYGPDAVCGWEPGFVGTCQPGAEVVLSRPRGCGSRGPYDSRRVCEGVFGCNLGDPTCVDSNWTCYSSDIKFVCPKDGAYTVMTRTLVGAQNDLTTLRSPVSGAGAHTFPAHERNVYRFKEGAFFGELFDVTGATVSIRTRVRVVGASNNLVKEFSEDGGITWTTQLPADPNRVIYQEMFSCHSAMWDFYTVFEKSRVCAGSTGWGCAANHVGNCEPWTASPKQDPVLSELEDGACGTSDAPPIAGDGDYGACNDQRKLGKTWSNVVTTWLVHPCDLWGPASTARETCLDNPLPRVKPIVRPRPIGLRW